MGLGRDVFPTNGEPAFGLSPFSLFLLLAVLASRENALLFDPILWRTGLFCFKRSGVRERSSCRSNRFLGAVGLLESGRRLRLVRGRGREAIRAESPPEATPLLLIETSLSKDEDSLDILLSKFLCLLPEVKNAIGYLSLLCVNNGKKCVCNDDAFSFLPSVLTIYRRLKIEEKSPGWLFPDENTLKVKSIDFIS